MIIAWCDSISINITMNLLLYAPDTFDFVVLLCEKATLAHKKILLNQDISQKTAQFTSH